MSCYSDCGRVAPCLSLAIGTPASLTTTQSRTVCGVYEITIRISRIIQTVCQADFGVLLCFVESISHKRYKSSRKRPKTLHNKPRAWKNLHIIINVSVYRVLELDSLELRRVRADLLFTYKLVFGLIDASLHDFFIPRFNESRRGYDYKLYIPTCKSNIRSNSF